MKQKFNGVSEQGKTGLLWTVFDGGPFQGRRVASFSDRQEAWDYQEWMNTRPPSPEPAKSKEGETPELLKLVPSNWNNSETHAWLEGYAKGVSNQESNLAELRAICEGMAEYVKNVKEAYEFEQDLTDMSSTNATEIFKAQEALAAWKAFQSRNL